MGIAPSYDGGGSTKKPRKPRKPAPVRHAFSPSPTNVEGSNYTGYATSRRTSTSHSGFTPSPTSVEGSYSSPRFTPSPRLVESFTPGRTSFYNPVSFLEKLFSPSPSRVEGIGSGLNNKPYSPSPTNAEESAPNVVDYLAGLFSPSPRNAEQGDSTFEPSPVIDLMNRLANISPQSVEGMSNSPSGFTRSPLNAEHGARFNPSPRYVEGSPYNPDALPVGDLPGNRQTGVNFPTPDPRSFAGSPNPMDRMQFALGAGNTQHARPYTLFGADKSKPQQGARGSLRKMISNWFSGEKVNYEPKPEEGEQTSLFDFGSGMFGEPGKRNAPDLTIPQTVEQHKRGGFDAKFEELLQAYTNSGSAAVGPEGMPELLEDYEGNIFSQRFNRYLAEQAAKKANGEPTDTQEEIAKKFLTGFQDFASPIEGLSKSAMTSDFGPRVHPVTGGSSYHTGDDLSAPMGTPIRAVSNGVVEEANAGDSIYGNQVILRHGNKKESMYGHMSKFVVAPGEKVKEGQIIGYVGSTGLSTGPHLHLETWNQGDPFDPTGLLQGADPQDTIPNAPYTGPPLTGGGQGDATSGNSVPYRYQENPPPAAPANPSGVVPNSMMYGMAAPVQSSLGQMPGGDLGAFLQAISTQESGGDYGAVGVPTGSGTALGKYQILDSNIAGPGGWDAETIGQEITPQQFLSSPELQEAIARAKLTQYFQQFGPAGAAKAWYAGPGNAYSNSDSSQYGGPSINDYAASVLANMRKYM